jgi:hypothetical protein
MFPSAGMLEDGEVDSACSDCSPVVALEVAFGAGDDGGAGGTASWALLCRPGGGAADVAADDRGPAGVLGWAPPCGTGDPTVVFGLAAVGSRAGGDGTSAPCFGGELGWELSPPRQ